MASPLLTSIRNRGQSGCSVPDVGRGRGEQDDEAGDRPDDERGPRDRARGVVRPAFAFG
jgi:hypothetical protein